MLVIFFLFYFLHLSLIIKERKLYLWNFGKLWFNWKRWHAGNISKYLKQLTTNLAWKIVKEKESSIGPYLIFFKLYKTKPTYNFHQISQFWPNFISQPNFTISTKFHNFDQIPQFPIREGVKKTGKKRSGWPLGAVFFFDAFPIILV